MDSALKDSEVSSTTTENLHINRNMFASGETSSGIMNTNNVRSNKVNNQSLRDKLTPLISNKNGGESESALEANHEIMTSESSNNNAYYHRQHNFNNRDMELSLADSDEEDDDEEDEDDQEELQQMEMRQAEEDYGDIQFFHHKLLLQQHLSHNEFNLGSGGVSSFGSANGLVNIRNSGVDSFHIEECDDNGIGNSFSENPFVFPECNGIMEYGEPQFFPGNCNGYLETILEETDEEFEEEEGCSGRWWTADSDTDTDSVIQRVDNGQNQQHQKPSCNNNQSTIQNATSAGCTTNLKSVENVEDLSSQSTFRSSASSRPFELEDLHLLDQLDLAFEETLMEPRRRSGFAAFGHQLHLLDQPLEKSNAKGKNVQHLSTLDDERRNPFHGGGRDGRVTLQRSASHDGERSTVFSDEHFMANKEEKDSQLISYQNVKGQINDKEDVNKGLGNAESKETFGSSLSPSSSDSEPHEVAEEDFFYSSPGSEESEEGGSSSDDSEKNGAGVVLAEFSLSQSIGGGGIGGSLGANNQFNSAFGSAKNRRSFDAPSASSRLKSFRSFDSLNSLSGTELLFSKADTFPSFHYIKEDVEPASSGSGSPSSPRCNLTSCSTNDVPGASTGRETSGGEDESQSLPSHHSVVGFPPTFNKITKKNSYSSSSTSTASSSSNSASGMMSTENLSEDSGIGGPDGAPTTTTLIEKQESCCGSESFSDERGVRTDQQEGEEEGKSAKEYIAKSEFALNPLVFSSLSSSETSSNSASINSVPSLNHNDFSDPDSSSRIQEEQGHLNNTYTSSGENTIISSFSNTIYSKPNNNEDTKPISHNSLSDSHFSKVDESNFTPQIVSHVKSHEQKEEMGSYNNKVEQQKEIPPTNTFDAVEKEQEECPISINKHQILPVLSARTVVCGPHPYSDSNVQIHQDQHCIIKAADEAKTLLLETGRLLENDNKRDYSLKVNNPDSSCEIINSNNNSKPCVPLRSSSINNLQTSSSALGVSDKADTGQIENPPDLVIFQQKDYFVKDSSHIINPNLVENVTEDKSIIIVGSASSSQQLSDQSPRCVGVIPQVPLPYIEENEMQELRDSLIRINNLHEVLNEETPEVLEEETGSPPPSYHSNSSKSNIIESGVDELDGRLKHLKPKASEEQLCQMANVNSNTEDEYQSSNEYQDKRHEYNVKRRERSNSESEFESAESAVEEDSIALAYAIVNSPTKGGSASSSPTPEELNGMNIKCVHANVVNNNSNGESGPVSTLTMVVDSYKHTENDDDDDRNGMQAQHKYKEEHDVDVKFFASPSGSELACAGQDGQSAALNANNNNDNNSTEPASPPMKTKNASISLHHHHLQENKVPEQRGAAATQSYYRNPNNVNSTTTTTITYHEEAVGHELSKPSRSVNLSNSSSADVVHYNNHQKSHSANSNVSGGECGKVDKHKHSHHNDDYIERDEQEELVIAKPIDPVHIGVAEVKKFAQLDSTVSRKLHHHQQQYHHTLGESESENIIRSSSPGNNVKADQAILGHSNFGFFGRSSSTSNTTTPAISSSSYSTGNTGNRFTAQHSSTLPPTIVKLDPKSIVGKSKRGKPSHTESSELSSYGFPSPCSYPISDADLHLCSEEGEYWKKIPIEERANKRNRDQLKDQHNIVNKLHLEDIKCGIHPENFTVPLAVYSAACLAVAPSIPSKRLVFVNEGDQHQLFKGIQQQQESSSTITREKSATSSNNTSRKGLIQLPTTNGAGSNSSSSSSVPDILVVKQTHLHDSDDNKESASKRSRMEIDTHPPNVGPNVGSGDRRSTSPGSEGIPIKTRTYGPRNEVEVVLVSSSRTPSPAPVPGGSFPYSSSLKQNHPSSSSSLGEEGNNDTSSGTVADPPAKAPRTRVHFSPVVSEISWRESYIDQNSEFSGSSEDIIAKLAEVNQGEGFFGTKTGAATIEKSGDSGSSGCSYHNSSGMDSSLVRPLQMISADHREREIMEDHHTHNTTRQPSPGSVPGKGPILVEKVQMRSSFLQGGEDDDDEDEDDELERKLTMDIHLTDHGSIIHDSANKPPVYEDDFDRDDFARKEGIEFRSGASSSASSRKTIVDNGESGNNKNGILDLYEDVNVEIEPINKKSGSTTLSMVPDLLSQCENASNAQTHINVCIEEVQPSNNKSAVVKPSRKSHSPSPSPLLYNNKSEEIPPPPLMDTESQPHHQQQQIFPKIFAEESNGSSFSKSGKSDSKNNSSSSLNKGRKSKGFSLGSSSSGSKKGGENVKENKEVTVKDKEMEASKENKAKGSKPGFFERLSKIRLSGSKPKKQKVHPKIDELDSAAKGNQPLKTHNPVNLNGNFSNGNGTGSTTNTSNITNPPLGQVKLTKSTQPILKKSPANSPTPVIPNYSTTTADFESEQEPNESHEAFENILEEIAGIKGIKMRMNKSSSSNNGNTPENTSSTTSSPPPKKEVRSFAKRKQFYNNDSSSPSPPVSPNGRSTSNSDLGRKLSQFKEETSKTRVVISKSHPDLELIEDMVRQQSTSPEPPHNNNANAKKAQTEGLMKESKSSSESKKSPKKSSMSETGQKNEREWYKLLKSAAEKYYYRGSSSSNKDDFHQEKPTSSIKTGIVETDLDTGASREMLDAEIVELDKVPFYTVSTSEIPSSISTGPITTTATSPGSSTKARSLTNLSTRLPLSVAPSNNYQDVDLLTQGDLNDFDERAKSYEFLLDDNQKSSSVPPENKLRTLETRKLSEHELRIQRSLQRLNVPDWYKKHETSVGASNSVDGPSADYNHADKPGNLKILNRRSEYGSAGGLAGGWAGLSAFKAPSMSSLQSSNGGRYSGSLNRSNFIRGRPATMSATGLSKESLIGGGSASHSPSAYDRSSFTYGMPFAMTRFSHGRMSTNSGNITPSSTPDSSLTITSTSYVKKPYLGWRSQERLNVAASSASSGPPKLSVYLPPEERLAAEVLKAKVSIRPPISDRPPLPKPPPRSEKTALTSTSPNFDNQSSTSTFVNKSSSTATVTKANQKNSIPPPKFNDDDDEQSKLPALKKENRPSDVHDVHHSIRQVTEAISQFVTKDTEEVPKPQPRKKSSGKKVWKETSFVGQKPDNKK